MPTPWRTRGQYDGADYDLDHLAHFRRTIQLADGSDQCVEFRFGYHCFTEENKRSADYRKPFADGDHPHEKRLFCPQRWFLSRQLPVALKGPLDAARLVAVPDFQWVWRLRVEGISLPYAIT